jgi:hypothetical protein
LENILPDQRLEKPKELQPNQNKEVVLFLAVMLLFEQFKTNYW